MVTYVASLGEYMNVAAERDIPLKVIVCETELGKNPVYLTILYFTPQLKLFSSFRTVIFFIILSLV